MGDKTGKRAGLKRQIHEDGFLKRDAAVKIFLTFRLFLVLFVRVGQRVGFGAVNCTVLVVGRRVNGVKF